MAQTVTDLHNAIAAVCPILGVSVGSWTDKSTWQINFAPSATDPQKTAAQTVVTNFDPTAPDLDDQFVSDTNRQNIVTAIQTATPTQIVNWVNNNVTDLASAKVVLAKILLLIARTIKT